MQSAHSRVLDDLIDLTEDREARMRENVLHDGANEIGAQVDIGLTDGDGSLNEVDMQVSADVHDE